MSKKMGYVNLIDFHNLYTRLGIHKDAGLALFEKKTKVNAVTTCIPTTGKNVCLSINKIRKMCCNPVEDTKDLTNVTFELLFKHTLLFRNTKAKMSYLTAHSELTAQQVLDMILNWPDFLIYCRNHKIIVNIYNEPGYAFFSATGNTLIVIHKKSEDIAYMPEEIIRFHDVKTDHMSKYIFSAGVREIADPTTIARTSYIKIPIPERANSINPIITVPVEEPTSGIYACA